MKLVMFKKDVFQKNYFLATLKHVAKTVAHVDLTDHIIQVVFTIFDENSKYFCTITFLFNIDFGNNYK